jgi:bifunctional DNase/RNase
MTNNKQQTAVELFWNQLPEILPFTVDTETAVKLQEAYQQAQEMERQRMIEFTNEWFEEYQCGLDNFKNPEKYYNETYGGGEQ